MAWDSKESLFSEVEYPTFPEDTKKKLARFLSEGRFGAEVSREETRLLRLAAGRLRHESLDTACKELEQKYGNDAAEQDLQPTPTFYHGVSDIVPAAELDQGKQIYHVSFAKDKAGTPFAFVFDVIDGRGYPAHIKKRSVGHSVSACRCLRQDSPYLLVKTGHGKDEKLVSYDVIENKWETIPTSKRIYLQPYVVEIANHVYMFGGKSQDIRKLEEETWRPCTALIHPVFDPMYVVGRNKLTIFDGKTVQIFDAFTNKVKYFNTFKIPHGVAVNIANHACVLTRSTIVQFDESTESCTLHNLNSNLLMNVDLIGAICHERQVFIITKKDVCWQVFRLSLDDLIITPVCSIDTVRRGGEFTVLSSCLVQSSLNYRLLPFLDFDERRKYCRRLESS